MTHSSPVRPVHPPGHTDLPTPALKFSEDQVLHKLKHYLPAQAPLKDFIHHNTLHAFQSERFFTAALKASGIFGYRTLLDLEEYRALYAQGKIRRDILDRIIQEKTPDSPGEFYTRLLDKRFDKTRSPRVGSLRSMWKATYSIDIDAYVHPLLFRILGSFLDQGISMWNFPVKKLGLIASLQELEQNSFTSFFKNERARNLLLQFDVSIKDALGILVGDEDLYEGYLFDQQFAHPGWSGIVSSIEDHPNTLLDKKKISLREVIVLESLLEIDYLEHVLKDSWKPLSNHIRAEQRQSYFSPVPVSEEHELLTVWQKAYEWSYYDEVLAGITIEKKTEPVNVPKSFQAMFCIDDRSCSMRRHLELLDPFCETFGTPGFFGVEFYYQPEHGKFLTKLCPAPIEPRYLIKERDAKKKKIKDAHFSKKSHSLFRGWLITNTLGFWAAIKLFFQIFRPTDTPATAASFKHMDEFSKLTIRHTGKTEKGLQVGFTVEEMATRVENLLRSIGMLDHLASLVYVVGHGSSSVNNPHYAAYDCGACSGRPGSVNARVFSAMANDREVRNHLLLKGIRIPPATQFVGALHDTTCDEIQFYDLHNLTGPNKFAHGRNALTFNHALSANAKERSRRFESINSRGPVEQIHERVKRRSVSLFEPRPELNHATNALCIIGRRTLSRNIFLDRRAFLNSYDYRVDPDGTLLAGILRAAAPVCGGINLEYFFSRVDSTKLGAGTKLPHNVIGLFGVGNGTDGDLRPGLPTQMTEVHDPVRLMIIIEHFPEVVLTTITREAATWEWFINEWMHLVVVHPESGDLSKLEKESFSPYIPSTTMVESVSDLTPYIENTSKSLPVYLFEK